MNITQRIKRLYIKLYKWLIIYYKYWPKGSLRKKRPRPAKLPNWLKRRPLTITIPGLGFAYTGPFRHFVFGYILTVFILCIIFV